MSASAVSDPATPSLDSMQPNFGSSQSGRNPSVSHLGHMLSTFTDANSVFYIWCLCECPECAHYWRYFFCSISCSYCGLFRACSAIKFDPIKLKNFKCENSKYVGAWAELKLRWVKPMITIRSTVSVTQLSFTPLHVCIFYFFNWVCHQSLRNLSLHRKNWMRNGTPGRLRCSFPFFAVRQIVWEALVSKSHLLLRLLITSKNSILRVLLRWQLIVKQNGQVYVIILSLISTYSNLYLLHPVESKIQHHRTTCIKLRRWCQL